MTSRSIWRSALLISFAIGCGASATTPAKPTGEDGLPPAPGDPGGPPLSPRTYPPADIVLVNGDIVRSNGHVDAIAIENNALEFEHVRERIGPNTRVIDLAGKTAVLGLTDAHCHLYGLGADMDNVSVRNTASEADAAKIIAEAAKTRAGGEWLLGRGWDQNKWKGGAFPTKASLDAVIKDRPVLLRRVDGHAAWVNSAALAAAGITKATKDPKGGKIVRDAKGQPTGVLIDAAMDLVDSKLPAPSAETIERRILAAAKVATELGFTAVHEMGISRDVDAVYQKLAVAGKLPLRVHAFMSGPTTAAAAADLQRRPSNVYGELGRYRMHGVKFFADGALGSRGARLYAPYSDEKGSHGLWVTEPAELTALVTLASGNGWHVAVHAIGDAGIGATLDAFEAARKVNPSSPLRVEHTQVIAPKDIERMVATKAIASMQPTHATSDMPWAEARVGKDRIAGAYAWRTMLDKNIPLAFGSDFPVEDVNPLLGLHAAVTRTAPDGTPAGGWYPAQKLTLDEALHAFTVGAEVATGLPPRPQTVADVTIFDGTLAETDLPKRKVLMTIVDGRIVHEVPGALTTSKGAP